MVELNILANSYAEENVINVLKESFAKVYADGYRDGYKAREEEFPVDFCENETKFVDLGLPSGTLWASDYERDGDDVAYLPYGKAGLLSIPTNAQWEELKDACKWEFDIDTAFDFCEARCVGPNGNTLRFKRTGKIDITAHSGSWETFFWIKEENEGNDNLAVHMYNSGKSQHYRNPYTHIEHFFSGYKLPVRLVKVK